MAWIKKFFPKSLSAEPRGWLDWIARAARNAWWDARNPQRVPPGHFYSAVPARQDVREHLARVSEQPRALADINLNEPGQLELLRALAAFYPQLPFPEHPRPDRRFRLDNDAFRYADAIVLFCLLAHLRPARVFEIGSGWSSAAMLDSFDHLGLSTRLMCIEPYPATLRQVLRAGDFARIALRAERAQSIDAALFDQLQANDVLFVDSSHVLKTGSDVQTIFFHILPRLRAGVWIHFHDIFYPFEYPREWIARGLQWNEIYFLRALLAHSARYRVALFPSFLEQCHSDLWRATMPLCRQGLAGSIWLRVQ